MNTKNQTTAEKFANIMLQKMEEMKNENWEKPWFPVCGKSNFYPQNFTGRKYESGNAFFLMILCAAKNYKTPLFLTFVQCRKMGIQILKGEESFPVYYFNFVAYHRKTRERLSFEEYKELTEEMKADYRLTSFINYYNVFNLDQTNFAEKEPEKFANILERYNKKEEDVTVSDAYNCAFLDNMLEQNSWICDVILRKQNRAYYSPSSDIIVCPKKEQFPNQNNFYGTLLHEMTHSTGTTNRLNRKMGTAFGDEDYAREEVVAELSAAFTGFQLGVFSEPSKDSATYLNGWISVLRKSPDYVFSLLDDVVKASNYIIEKITSNVETLESMAV